MAISMAPAVAAAEGPAGLDLKVIGLRSLKGNVLICLTTNGKAFPNCAKDGQARKMIVPAAKAANVRFTELAPGTYAVALIHDENANGKLDTALLIPREGFGFSNNPAIAFGPPKFGSASFPIGNGEATQSIKVKYMF